MLNDRRDDPLEGTEYTAQEKIGSGGMGEVYRATHKKLGKRVAVKLLKGTLVDSARLVERMRFEAQAAARIEDPRHVQVFDMGVTTQGRAFYVMELLEGRSLEDEIKKRGALPLREARYIMLEVLGGLEALHRAGLIHRDIKPGNIFYCDERLDRPRHVKLLDLGLVKKTAAAPAGAIAGQLKSIETPTAPGVMVGSPNYASPEQALGHEVDHRTDIYSAGLVLYKLITGQNPFAGKRSIVDALLAQLKELPEPPSTLAPVTRELDAVVLRALEKRADDRFASAAEFAKALRAARINPLEPTRATPSSGSLPLKTTPITQPLDEDDESQARMVVTRPSQRPTLANDAKAERHALATAPLSAADLAAMAARPRAPSTAPLSMAEVTSITRLSAVYGADSAVHNGTTGEPAPRAEPAIVPTPAAPPSPLGRRPRLIPVAIGTAVLVFVLVLVLAIWAQV